MSDTYNHVSGPSALAKLPAGTPLYYQDASGNYVHISNPAAYQALPAGTAIFTKNVNNGVEYNGQWYSIQEWQQMRGSLGIGGGGGGGGAGAPSGFASSDQQSIYDIINNQLTQWGISSLGKTVKQLLTQGLNEDAILVQLENTDAFKQRFAGNQERLKNGLSVLSPAEYIATENAYDQVLRQYGINDTFSTRDNFAKWIGGDVSATELQQRAKMASDLVQESDPTRRQLLSQFYGVTHSDIMATFLDPTQAMSTLNKKEFAATVGAAMQRYGLGANQQSAEGLFGTVGQDQAVQGIQQAGQAFAKTQTLAERYGAQYSAQDAINQYVLGQQGPADLQQHLAQQEEAQFVRGSGFTAQGNGVSRGSF